MMLKRKPYLVVPKFIEQPTWGGNYITTLKSWENVPFLTEKKIGNTNLYQLNYDNNNTSYLCLLESLNQPVNQNKNPFHIILQGKEQFMFLL